MAFIVLVKAIRMPELAYTAELQINRSKWPQCWLDALGFPKQNSY
jgi:hypothetical protein